MGGNQLAFGGNTLFYGDNLPILRAHIDTASVDLVYLDPPFNSQQSYNVLFRSAEGDPGSAQLHAFDDTWHWGSEAERTYHDLVHGESAELGNLAEALRTMIGPSDMLAYLVMMAPRLVELRRVLKPTGTLYLHCDPTSSHYLKMLLDAIFGPTNFRNEIIWKRTGSHNSAKRWGPVHDTILCYGLGGKTTWNQLWQPPDQEYLDLWYTNADAHGRYKRDDLTAPGVRRGDSGLPWRGLDPTERGRHWAIPTFAMELSGHGTTQERLDALDTAGRIHWPRKQGGMPRVKRYVEEAVGVPVGDVITDVRPLNNVAAERLGYPTQKPLALLDRIITTSSSPDDLVLDPFCGCGTTVDAAQRLGRRWIGIDISYLAIDVIDKRMRKVYGDGVAATYEIKGTPRDIEGARALAARDKFEFERWAVSLVGAQPNAKQVGDKGIDGTARFTIGPKTYGKILVSVKGGANINPSFVRDLAGTVAGHRAAMGVMVTLHPPTKKMLEAAATAGVYVHPNGHQYPRVQIITIQQLLKGERPNRPPMMNPYGSEAAMVEEKTPAAATARPARSAAV